MIIKHLNRQTNEWEEDYPTTWAEHFQELAYFFLKVSIIGLIAMVFTFSFTEAVTETMIRELPSFCELLKS